MHDWFPYVIANSRYIERTQPDGVKRRHYGSTIHLPTCPAIPKRDGVRYTYEWLLSDVAADRQKWRESQPFAKFYPCSRCRPSLPAVWAAAEDALAMDRARQAQYRAEQEFDAMQRDARHRAEQRESRIRNNAEQCAINALIESHAAEYAAIHERAVLVERLREYGVAR